MRNQVAIRFVNALTWYRLAMSPVLLMLVIGGERRLFAWLLPASFLTDIADGFIARALGRTTAQGALLDSIADDLTIAAGIAGLFVFYGWFVRAHLLLLILLFALYLVQLALVFIRFGRMSSFHTYAAKVAALLQGCFLITFFLLGEPCYYLFYSMACATLVDLLEEIVLAACLPQWGCDVKGLWWQWRSFKAGRQKK